MVIGNYKVSLKSGESAQLMSGGASESQATFYTALEKTQHVQDEVLDKLETMINSLTPASVTGGKVADQLKKAKDEALMKADRAHKELMSSLKEYFDRDTKFRREFAYEAMTGETKFGGNIGACTHFLVVS